MASLRRLSAWLVIVVLGSSVPSSLLADQDRVAVENGSRDALPSRAPVRLPVAFQRNDGQADARVRYLTRADDYTLFLLRDEAVVAPAHGRRGLRMAVEGARPDVSPAPGRELPGRIHHLRGRDSAGWVRDVPHFAEVTYPEVLPGIDQIWRKAGGRAEVRFVARPGSDPRAVTLRYEGCEALSIDDGRLVARMPSGSVVHSPPIAYQGEAAARQLVPVRYELAGDHRVRFRLGDYDATRELVIDPEIAFSSLYSGSGAEACNAVAVDASGACYVTGGTDSADLPMTAGSLEPTNPSGDPQAFVAKFAPDGASLVYATYVGGANDDDDEEEGQAIAVDAGGNAHVAGFTSSDEFPLVDATQATRAGRQEGFVLTLDSDGANLLFSTYLGGALSDDVRALALDAGGSIYVAGHTTSDDFPLQNPVQSMRTGFGGDGFVARYRAGVLQFSTYLGGANDEGVQGLAVDGTNTDPGGSDIVVCGTTSSTDFPTVAAYQGTRGGETHNNDGFVTRYAAQGGLAWSTYLGGASHDQARGVALDAAGNVYVTGDTWSDDFPVTAAFQPAPASAPDVFAVKLTAAGMLAYGTYLGGTDQEQGHAIAVTGTGEVWICGTTSSTDFPLVDPAQTERRGNPDLFVSRLAADAGSLLFSTYLGAPGGPVQDTALALSSNGSLAVVGGAYFAYPTTSGALIEDLAPGDVSTGFVTRFAAPGNEPPPNTTRSFVLPKKLRVRGGAKPGVKLKAFFDSGPDEVDLADPARVTLGPKSFDLPALAADPKGKVYQYTGQGLTLKIRPSRLGSSRGKLKLRFDGDLGEGVDANGAFTVRFENDSGIDAEGTCVLSNGGFTFGRKAGELIAPQLSIRKAKAVLSAVTRHKFKFVVGFTTDGRSPSTAPDIRVGFGDRFAVDIASDDLALHGKNFYLAHAVTGLDGVTLTYLKERCSVRGHDVDLGDVPQGSVPILLIFAQDDDVRGVFVRMARKGKIVKY